MARMDRRKRKKKVRIDLLELVGDIIELIAAFFEVVIGRFWK